MAIRKRNEREAFPQVAPNVAPATAEPVITREEFTLRKKQLEDLRRRANDADDLRAELSAIQELNKLCGLYRAHSDEPNDTAVELARQHLEGIGTVEKGLPLEELARRVAFQYMNAQN